MHKIGNTGFELMELIAWSDQSLSDLRGSWRGFLSYFLSNLLGVDAHNTDTIVMSCVAVQLDDLHEDLQNQDLSLFGIVRLVSMQLAKICGYPQEFGLASLFDWNPPTKAHQRNHSKKRKNIDYSREVRKWLKTIESLSKNSDFENHMMSWKALLEEAVQRWLSVEQAKVAS